MNNKISIVITLGKKHIHYCKALIASVMYFNPELEIIIIKDGFFETDFVKYHQNVHVIDSKEINKIHGLDLYILLNKLNILFLPQVGYDYDTYIHIDADSIMTNAIKYSDFNSHDFVILQGNKISRDNDQSMKTLSQYAFNPNDFEEYVFDKNELYFFSASHIAINKRIFPKLIDYLKIHRFELNKVFLNDKRIRFNDQGFFNLIINYLSYSGEISINLNNIGIYGKQNSGDFPKLTLQNVKNRIDTEVLFIHYTASSRRFTMKGHNFGEILDFFLKEFYKSNMKYYYEETIRIFELCKNWVLKKLRNKLKYLRRI